MARIALHYHSAINYCPVDREDTLALARIYAIRLRWAVCYCFFDRVMRLSETVSERYFCRFNFNVVGNVRSLTFD